MKDATSKKFILSFMVDVSLSLAPGELIKKGLRNQS